MNQETTRFCWYSIKHMDQVTWAWRWKKKRTSWWQSSLNKPSPISIISMISWHLRLHLCFQVFRRIGVASLQKTLPGWTFFDLEKAIEDLELIHGMFYPLFWLWRGDHKCMYICLVYICIYIYIYIYTVYNTVYIYIRMYIDILPSIGSSGMIYHPRCRCWNI